MIEDIEKDNSPTNFHLTFTHLNIVYLFTLILIYSIFVLYFNFF